LRKIIDDFGGAMVVKPLQRFGGEGVIKVSTRDRMNLNSLIHYYVRAYESYARREPIMVQEYLKSVKQDGDIRILLLNGEIIGAMRRKPKKGDFRTNVHAGGEVFTHRVTAHEQRVCRVIKDKLIQDGLYFAGIDLIDGKLVEVNCVSPGGIPRINRLNNVRLERKVIDFIEQKANKISHAPYRKRAGE
jgi:glutathione synthase